MAGTLILFFSVPVRADPITGPRENPTRLDRWAETLGWQLGVQAYSFNRFTFFEAVDKTAALGLKYIEAYPGQRIGAGTGDTAVMSFTMSPGARAAVKKKCADSGIRLTNFGVVTPGSTGEWRELFEFAREMSISTIVTEPAPEKMDLVEALCDEFKINIAIHNHPKPSRYWNPDTVLALISNRSERIGLCADTGHWRRSGLDPLACLKKCEGRIISLHFKDLNQVEQPAHDVPWGTGVNNVWGMLTELKRQKFKGVFSIEYEYNWNNSMPEISQCIQYFNLVSAALSPYGFRPLFKTGLSDAQFPAGGWVMTNDILSAQGKGDIWTKTRYSNFVLKVEYKTKKDSNSGVFLRTGSIQNWLHTGMEIQILDQPNDNPKHRSGALYDVLAPVEQMQKKTGEWNRYTIIANDNRIYVILNGEQVINADLDQWTEAHKNPDGTPNKFNTAYKDMPREGYIGLQYHGTPIWYKGLLVKALW